LSRGIFAILKSTICNINNQLLKKLTFAKRIKTTKLNNDIITALQKELGDSKVLLREAVQERYSHIWRMNEPLTAKAVILPSSTEDVSKALKICHAHSQKVVIHGGLTNLVGSRYVK